MNKFQKLFITVGVASAVGITFALAALKVIPESFDWEEDESSE
jgi:hypothetical protein